eukprot:TRINITY_DN913_c0_g3_i1.p3 TRINITY_DN913_c0_g3~~TRINITY_DN913_c0_g3_i1.p3  ORF type:complete len:132 (-),score=38.78 TRINITY_DN913_c0_g3_i1:80-475(-)
MSEIKLKKPFFKKVKDIKPGENGYNTYAKVLKVTKDEITKFNGEKLKIAEVVFGDSSAIIDARIVGKYAEILEQGKIFAIRNGKSTVFKERQRLELDEFGKITLEDSKLVESVNEKNNLSSILYEKVVKKF